MLNIFSPQRVSAWKRLWYCPARTSNTTLVGREWGRGFKCCLIQMLPLHLWDLNCSTEASSWTENKVHFAVPLEKVPLWDFRWLQWICIEVKVKTALPLLHPLLDSCFSFTFNCLALSSPALYDVQVTPSTGFTRGISEGVRHLNRSTDPDLSAYILHSQELPLDSHSNFPIGPLAWFSASLHVSISNWILMTYQLLEALRQIRNKWKVLEFKRNSIFSHGLP